MERELNKEIVSAPNHFEAPYDEPEQITETKGSALDLTQHSKHAAFNSGAIRTDEDDAVDEKAIHAALSNPLVLRQIFVCLPTTQLIKVCSLVNKTWNIQARTFVRDHRKYKVNVHSEGAGQICTACSTLEALAHSLSGMSVIPINSICYTLETDCNGKHNCIFRPVENHEDILRIKLKALIIEMQYAQFCCASQLWFAQMLRENSGELQTLTLSGISPLLANLLKDWVPHLPKLETLSIRRPCRRDGGTYKDFCQRVIRNAPNLKTIDPGNMSCRVHSFLPDPKYFKLLDRVALIFNSAGCEETNLRIVEASSALKILGLTYNRRDCTVYKIFVGILEQLLQKNKESLEVLEFIFQGNIAKIFRSFQWPTLPKLERLRCYAIGSYSSLLRAIVTSVDYKGMFPALQSVRLQGNDFEVEELEQDESEEDPAPRACFCETVSKLEVDFDMGTVSFSQLKATFSAVVHLVLYRLESNNLPSFWQIFRLWPKLERLELRGRAMGLCRNHDAEFCGISRDEMRRYYGKDDEFLRAVHIVPIRPCISTLQNFKRLSIITRGSGQETGASARESDPQAMFLSRATNLMVFERLPLLIVDINFDDFIRSTPVTVMVGRLPSSITN